MNPEGLFDIFSHNVEGDLHTFGVRVDASHRVFTGHFPHMPVMPGVCSMYIIKECAGLAAGIKLRYDTVKDCKFLSTILPDKHPVLTVSLTLKQELGLYRLIAVIAVGNETMVKITAGLIEE